MTLKLVEGEGKPKPWKNGEAEQVVCRQCEHDIGIATSVFIPVESAPFYVKGKWKKGDLRYICATCMARGKVTRF